MSIDSKSLDNNIEGLSPEADQELYARHAEIKTFEDLEKQRGTPIPALFNMFYKFIQNPSTVSVESYKRMVDTDDTVGSAVDFLVICLSARLGEYVHPNPEVTKWVNKALSRIKGGFKNSVKELLSASWAGFAVQEKVWANDDMGFIIEKLVTLPPSTILFEVDRTGHLTEDGILQYQRNYNPYYLGSGGLFGSGFVQGTNKDMRPDPYAKLGDLPFPIRVSNTFNYLSIRIPRQKCVHYSFNAQGNFGNPYGRSLLRRAYKYYVMKDAFLQMLSVALDRKGTPIMVVYADGNTTLQSQDAALSGKNQRGNASAGVRADVAALDAFSNVHNDSVIVLPGKKGTVYEVDPIDVTANIDIFIASLDFCNKSIMRALLVPSLVFTSGDGSGSFALGQEHSKTFEKILDGMLEGVDEVLIDQIVKDMIKFNFPESVYKTDGFGEFTKREFSQEEMDKIMNTYSVGIDKGIIDSSDLNDLNKMRDTIGFDPREEIIEKPDPFGDIGGEDDGAPPEPPQA